MLIGAICDGETRITGFGRSADTEATVDAVRALGVEVYEHGYDTLRVFGNGLRGLRAPAEPIDCRNAGTLVRLLAGILAGQEERSFTLTGDASLVATAHGDGSPSRSAGWGRGSRPPTVTSRSSCTARARRRSTTRFPSRARR